MKLSKLWEKAEGGTVGVHYCKKCGCPLTSTNKDKLCDNCRRIKASTIRNTGLGLSGLFLVAIGFLFKRK